MSPDSSLGPWARVGIAAGASFLGSMLIYTDVIWNLFSRKEFSILKSKRFFGSALALSCGTLIVTALNALLPSAVTYMKEGRPYLTAKNVDGIVVPFFALGFLICQFMNFLVLRFASRSVVTCSHDLDNASRPRKSSVSAPVTEVSPLLDDHHHNHYDVDDESDSHSHSHHHSHHHGDLEQATPSASNDTFAGYSSAPFTLPASQPPHTHGSQLEVIESGSTADLLAIGLQTTLGISIHRIPEGLLLFAASQTDRQLGISIVLALTIHSFSEGFSIAAPLYGALKRRGVVLLLCFGLGCTPQLIGAAIGSVIFRGDGQLSGNSKFIFGVCMAGTAGFMFTVCIQMIGSAYRYMSQTAVLYGVILGVLLSLSARAL